MEKENKIYTIEEIAQKTKPIFEKYNIEKAYVFGSYARGEATANSDVDIMTVGKIDGFFSIGGLFEDLKKVLKKDVDLIREETYTKQKKIVQVSIDNKLNKQKEKFYKIIFKERKLIYGEK